MPTLEPRRLKRVVKGMNLTPLIHPCDVPIRYVEHPSKTRIDVVRIKPTKASSLTVLQYLLWCPASHYEYSARITLDARVQPDGSYLWGIFQRGNCYNRIDNCFYYQPSSSSQDDAYYAAHRFATVDEALAAWDAYKQTIDYREMVAMYERSNHDTTT